MSSATDRMYYLAANHVSTKSFICTTCGTQNCEEGGAYPVATHPDIYTLTPNGRILEEYQLVFITRGEGWFESASARKTKVKAGDMLVLFPGEKHSYHPDHKTGWKEFWVGFKCVSEESERWINSLFSREEPIQHLGLDERIAYIYDTIISLAHFVRKGCQKAIDGWITAMLSQVEYDRENYELLNRKHSQTVLDAQILLREHLHEHISPQEVAERLGVSYSLLREQFRLTTGVSMAGYAIQMRLNKSKMMLASTNKSIKEISYAIGYDSISRFCCFFKEHVGITASEYRANATKER